MPPKMRGPCTGTGCHGPQYSKGLCRRCYNKQWRDSRKRVSCAMVDCTNLAVSRGLCNKHRT